MTSRPAARFTAAAVVLLLASAPAARAALPGASARLPTVLPATPAGTDPAPAFTRAPAGPSVAPAALEEPSLPPATPFERVVRPPDERPSQRLALYAALAGAAFVGASFPLSAEADRRYERYLAEVDVARMDEHFRGAERMDHYSAAALLTGEALLATAVWLRFVREPQRRGVAVEIRPDRCGLALRY
jgi:hypothetical protein